jgi:hypothetical protein
VNEKIKQVADAVKAALQEHPSVRLVANGPGGEEALKLLFEYVGMRAIEAMREPSKEMVIAGRYPAGGGPEAEATWEAMIDAALEGK